MPGALILIKAESGAMKYVHSALKDLENIQEVKMLTGPYDVMAIVRAEDFSEIGDALVKRIRGIKGVQKTTTNVFIG